MKDFNKLSTLNKRLTVGWFLLATLVCMASLQGWRVTDFEAFHQFAFALMAAPFVYGSVRPLLTAQGRSNALELIKSLGLVLAVLAAVAAAAVAIFVVCAMLPTPSDSTLIIVLLVLLLLKR